jgi:hypothetical protein
MQGGDSSGAGWGRGFLVSYRFGGRSETVLDTSWEGTCPVSEGMCSLTAAGGVSGHPVVTGRRDGATFQQSSLKRRTAP